MDLVIRRGRLFGSGSIMDIAIDEGKIKSVGKELRLKGEVEVSASGKLVLPTFIEPHVHLDKAFLAERLPEATSLSEARRLVREAKETFTAEDVTERAERCIARAVQNGVTIIRSHVDVDETVGLTSVKALLKLKERYADVLDIQVVAFPQEGLFKKGGSEELLQKALESGADVVGGLPEAEGTPNEAKAQIEIVTALAKERGLPVDVHCDVQPYTNYIEHYISCVVKNGLSGRATADHLIALAYYDDTYARKLIQALADARVSVITNPCTMMVSGSGGAPPLGRGVTRIRELSDSVNLSFGLDNIVDPYNPFGDFDPLRNGWLLAYAGQLNRKDDPERVIRMATHNAALALCISGYGLRQGDSADLNVVGASSPREALRLGARADVVVKRGRVVSARHERIELRLTR
jgi:cytosine deaminase